MGERGEQGDWGQGEVSELVAAQVEAGELFEFGNVDESEVSDAIVVQKQLLHLGHACADDLHPLICDIVLSHDQGLDVGERPDTFDIGVCDVGLWQVDLISMCVYDSIFEYHLFGCMPSRAFILCEFVLNLLELFL